MKKRKTFEGEKQFTASVWILNKTHPKKMLLIRHRKLGKWMQPGGHIEKFENPIEAAIREVFEETGLNIGFLADQIKKAENDASFLPIPKFFMEQKIPAYNDEPEHFHLDINYVVEVQEQRLKFNKKETHDIGWFTKEEIKKLPTHKDTKIVVNELM
jgi:8-oxo-dGTP pyrophosphatase MutT (NUDIX family)